LQQLYDNGDTLGVTDTHPLYSLDRQQFIPTEDIKVGEHLLSKSGVITVVSKTFDPTPQEVYNLEVGQWHNFLVGVSGVVVHNSYLDKLLKEYRFENMFNSYKQKFLNLLTKEEEVGIRFYTLNDVSEPLNRMLRGDIQITEFYEALAKTMSSGLDKLKGFKGITTGGYSMPTKYIKSNFIDNVGGEFRPGYFMSSSKSSSVAADFTGNIEITFIGKNGKEIKTLSTLPAEDEVLFNMTSVFEVKSAKLNGSIYEVKLIEK
jgi:hypothetical protein